MGLFDKKICDNCGAKIGLLGKRKLEDGLICKDCASKLSPWFSERKQSTLAEIQEQLRYREENQQVLASLHPSLKLGGLRIGDYSVYIDSSKGKFFVTSLANYQSSNPDVIDISQVTSCQCEPSESRTEIKFRGPDGQEQSYTPPRYEYEYVFWIKISVNNPYFNEMKFRLNSSRVDMGTPEFMTYQNMANQICSALSGGAAGGMNMNAGMNNMNTMGMGGMMNSGMNMGGMSMAPNMTMGAAGMNMGGMINSGMNTGNMGAAVAGRAGAQYSAPGIKIKCSKCGWEPEDPSAAPKFCPNCGDRFGSSDIG